MNITIPQSETDEMTCCRQYFHRAALEWTNRETQTWGTHEYSLFMYRFRNKAVKDIILSMDATTIQATRVVVTVRFVLAATARYQSSA